MRHDKAAALQRIFKDRWTEKMINDPSMMCDRIESLINPITDIFSVRAEPVFNKEKECYFYDLYLEIYINKRAKTIGLIEDISMTKNTLILKLSSKEEYEVRVQIDKWR